MRSKVKHARDRIEVLRLALLSPTSEEVGAALPGLNEAVLCLSAVEQELSEGAYVPYEVCRDVKLLKNDLRISVRLIEQGLDFCQSWAKMLGGGPGYTQTGHGAQARPEGTLSLRG